MREATYRLALADAMQLHDERVRLAIDDARRLRAELEAAESRQWAVVQARDAFKAGIMSAESLHKARSQIVNAEYEDSLPPIDAPEVPR